MEVTPRTVTVAGFSHTDIQRAIDSLPSGGTIYLPNGTYHLERTIALTSCIAIVGDGPDATTRLVLAPGTNSHAFVNRDQQGNERIELRGFSLDGDMAHQDPPFEGARAFAFGAFFRNVKGLVIDSVDVRRTRQTAFQLNGCNNVEIANVNATEVGCSAVATSCIADIVIRNMTVTAAAVAETHSAIHLGSCTGGYVEASIDGCSGNGVMLDARSAPLSDVVVRCVVKRSQRGVLVGGGGNHAVGNVFLTGEYSNNRECGILVANATNVFIVDTLIDSNAEHGILLQGKSGARHCVIADCRISDSPVAIVERDGSRDNYRTGNLID